MPSTVIRRFAYDPATQALAVEFISSRRYLYHDVPDEVATDFRGAFSKGRFFNARIRDQFACTPLDSRTDFDLPQQSRRPSRRPAKQQGDADAHAG
jgi:lysyl-tRNA synthetase class 2